ncbi:hypothetical protein C8R43DRAFT_1118535 [Mycena crocata]|nr:hypothetical protein C8R43DRAFT_1118535 [Mycena crocata]
MSFDLLPPEVDGSIAKNLALGDLISFGQCEYSTRNIAQDVVAIRISTALGPFFPEEEGMFWRLLGQGVGAIVGSTPYWVSLAEPEWTPSDLNLLVRHAGEHGMAHFLLATGWSETDAPEWPDWIGRADCVGNFSRVYAEGRDDRTRLFTHPGRPTITLTAVGQNNIMRRLCYGRHTLQAAITPTAFISLYPLHFFQGIAIARNGATKTVDAYRAMKQCLYDTGITLHDDNSTVDFPCGRQCVGLVRRLRGGRHIGLFEWRNQEDSSNIDELGRDAYAGFEKIQYAVKWNLARCMMGECDYFGFPARPI